MHLSRGVKAPRIKDASGPLAERDGQESRTFETYLARVLEEEILARVTSGGQPWVRAARLLPAVKTFDDVDFTCQRSVKKHVAGAPGPCRPRVPGAVQRRGNM